MFRQKSQCPPSLPFIRKTKSTKEYYPSACVQEPNQYIREFQPRAVGIKSRARSSQESHDPDGVGNPQSLRRDLSRHECLAPPKSAPSTAAEQLTSNISFMLKPPSENETRCGPWLSQRWASWPTSPNPSDQDHSFGSTVKAG